MRNAEKLIRRWLKSSKEERETFLGLALARPVLGNQWVVSTVKDLPEETEVWHPITHVAESRGVDEGKLTSFALQNADKYHIVTELGHPEVNTWNVDKLVADFKADYAQH